MPTRLRSLTKELAEARKQAEAHRQAARADFEKWLKTAKSETVRALVPAKGLRLYAKLSEGSGSKVSVTFDGKPLFTAQDSTFVGPGKIALWTKADSVTHFDTIAIMPLD